MYDKEKVYDEEIAPLLQRIFEVCKREELPMVAQFYLSEESPNSDSVQPLYCSSVIIPGERNEEEGIQQLKSISKIMKYGTNGPPMVMTAMIRK
ncbi:hypothetical protein [Bacillus wiedmannii]|uniref:hypothetical protein n=1 Tax=Bacillus wiedmannii TaxID=1890302 RepID=UPI0015D47CC7|nr:hypothetical protein [Bacillus wiedmannii]